MITTIKGFPKREHMLRHEQMYLSIGYKRLEGRRCPNGTRHKLKMHYRNEYVVLYHE